MKRFWGWVLILSCLLSGCSVQEPDARVAATTLPVYELTVRLCADTGITVTRLVTESVSCLHDYSLNVRQVRAASAAEVVVISGAGLEDFMSDVLVNAENIIDASSGIELLESTEIHEHIEDVQEDADSHIWLSPENAMRMAENICAGLAAVYPGYADTFKANLVPLLSDLEALQAYGEEQLSDLSCREMVTFHDGFSYFAESFGLHVLKAIEEESGSEASAAELKDIITLIRQYALPAVFTETNGSDSAASVISRETGVKIYTLDMAMAGDSYFTAMYHNIDTIREALG